MKISFIQIGFALITIGALTSASYFITSRCQQATTKNTATEEKQLLSEQPLRAAAKIHLLESPSVVFDYVFEASSLPQWMPNLNSVKYNHETSATLDEIGVGSQRLMMFDGQAEIEEIVQFQPPHTIAYRIIKGVPVKDHLSIISIKSDGEGGSVLSWQQHFAIKRTSVVGWAMPFMVRQFMHQSQTNLANTFQGEVINTNLCHFR